MNSALRKPSSADDRSASSSAIALVACTRVLCPALSPRAAGAGPVRDGQQVRVAWLDSRRALGVAVARLSGLRSARSRALAATAAARAPPRLQTDAGRNRGG